MNSLFTDIIPIQSWANSQHTPLVIAGPCSAESEKQIIETAKAIARNNNTTIFRAGVWKARTRPGAFEGAGEQALDWLQNVKAETGLHTAIEVANANHVELALKKNIDVLWIGARTTVNPFYVQEIADALKGVDIPVLIKNPTHPELQLWIGAIERFYEAGIRKLAGIHRGFYSFEKTHLRNAPNWSIAIALKTAIPNLPVICDPSHIAGKRELVLDIAQQAMDLGMEGLMIETHINPAIALSDAQQQLDPTQLNDLLLQLHIPSDKKQKDIIYESRLEEFRELIDKIDADILEIISKRMNVVEDIGEHKQLYNSAIFQLERWLDIIKTRKKLGTLQGLDEKFVKNLFALIHAEALSIQQQQRQSAPIAKPGIGQ